MNCWRESVPHKKLHLNETVVLSMGKATIRFFMAYYGMIPRTPRQITNGGGGRGGGGGAPGAVLTNSPLGRPTNVDENGELEVDGTRGHLVGQAGDLAEAVQALHI